ncbi:MAG: hypothetical protein AAF806_10870, partial [Bacteroidota bacterium]
MKKNYQIKFNQPKQISSEQIKKHQDFDALFASFEQKHPPKQKTSNFRRIIWMGSAIAAATIGVVFWFNQTTIDVTEQYYEAQMAYFEEQPYINPPLENVRPTFASYQVNARTGGTYPYSENSKLIVPEAAFQGADGQALEGEVNLFYREMHDAVDFFLSGIPLTYDSAGVNYTLESAGMIEIYAEQDGQRVRMMPGKSIDIELASEISIPFLNVPPKFNIYKLDVEARNWVYQEPNQMSVLTSAAPSDNPVIQAYQNQLEEITRQEQQALAQLEARIAQPSAPQKPNTRNSDLPTLELDFLDSFNGSEEAKAIRNQYDGAVWQLSPNSQAIPADAVSKEWASADMKELENGEFELSLIKEEERLSLIVQPVLLDADYAKALEQYEADLLAYEQKSVERDGMLTADRTALEVEYAEKKQAIVAAMEQENQTYTNTSPRQKRKIVNRFKANSFGIWNCDRPIAPDPQQAIVAFEDQFGNTYENQTAYLLDKNRNSVERILVTENTVLEFDINSTHLLWLVNVDRQVTVMRPEAFKALKTGTEKQQKVDLTLLDQKLEDEEDVRRVV